MQQYLPLAVLKPSKPGANPSSSKSLQQYLPLAVLKPEYEKLLQIDLCRLQQYLPLAVLKRVFRSESFKLIIELQQYLPLAVLKLSSIPATLTKFVSLLQQYLPLAVLKRYHRLHRIDFAIMVATALTVYGIETHICETIGITAEQMRLQQHLPFTVLKLTFIGMIYIYIYVCCNSTYHLRHMTKNSIIRWEYPTNTKKLYPRSPKVEFSSINLYNTMLIVSYVCLIYN